MKIEAQCKGRVRCVRGPWWPAGWLCVMQSLCKSASPVAAAQAALRRQCIAASTCLGLAPRGQPRERSRMAHSQSRAVMAAGSLRPPLHPTPTNVCANCEELPVQLFWGEDDDECAVCDNRLCERIGCRVQVKFGGSAVWLCPRCIMNEHGPTPSDTEAEDL